VAAERTGGCGVSVVILRGDARALPLPDASVDLIACSPPYFAQRDYRDGGQSMAGQIGSEETPAGYVANLVAVMRECVRVLKPGGSVFFNLGDKYSQRVQVRRSSHQPGIFPGKFGEFSQSWAERAGHGATRMPHQNVISGDGAFIPEKSLMGLPWRFAFACTDELGLILRRDIIWAKTSAIPESVNDRCATRHEYLFHFTRQARYFAAVDEIREPHKAQSVARTQRRYDAGDLFSVKTPNTLNPVQFCHPLGALPGSVWEINSAPLVVPDHIAHASCCGGRKRERCEDGLGHYAAWPPALVKKIILGWCPSGICVQCGEGRFPVSLQAHREPNDRLSILTRARTSSATGTHVGSTLGYPATSASRRITGYACACTPCTRHKGDRGRERTGQGYAQETGRDAHPHGGVGVLPRTGPWREYHFDRWTPAPTRPAVILDPFSGTGTTVMVADVLGRTGIGIERSQDYCRLAQWRTADPAERARALGVPKPPPVPQGQMDLFGDGAA